MKNEVPVGAVIAVTLRERGYITYIELQEVVDKLLASHPRALIDISHNAIEHALEYHGDLFRQITARKANVIVRAKSWDNLQTPSEYIQALFLNDIPPNILRTLEDAVDALD